VTPDVESHVRARLASVLDKFKGAQVLESDGGVATVDVRLMNSQAEVKLQPRITNKAVQETYVRQGELKVCVSVGGGWFLERGLGLGGVLRDRTHPPTTTLRHPGSVNLTRPTHTPPPGV